MTKILKPGTWIDSFPLGPFLEKLDELKSVEAKRRVLILTEFRSSLFTILTTYTWIGYVRRRIDDDLYNDLEFFEKLRLVGQRARVNADELPPSNAHLTNIDVISLIIFLNVLMDDVARFLKFLFIGKERARFTPETKSFYKLKKAMHDFEGQKLEELNRIIQNTDWYEELKNLRDNPIVHKGDKSSAIGREGERIGIYLRYVQNREIRERFMSNLEIDSICENVYRFLKDLNEFLCENFDYLPLEVTRLSS